MPRAERIEFIVRSYLDFLCSIFKEFFFNTFLSNMNDFKRVIWPFCLDLNTYYYSESEWIWE